MDAKEQLLATLEKLRERTIEFARRLRSDVLPDLKTQKDLHRRWSEIAREGSIKAERVRVQSEFRLGSVRGTYPVPIVDVVFGSRGNDMRLLVLDFIALAEVAGTCPLEVSHRSARELIKAVYGDDLPNPDEPGHVVDCWEAREGLFSANPAERAKYRNWQLPKLPSTGVPTGAEPPHPPPAPPPNQNPFGEIGSGLVSHGESIKSAAEMVVGAALLALLFQQPKRR